MERCRLAAPEEIYSPEHGICWAEIWAMMLLLWLKLGLIKIDRRVADPRRLATLLGWSTKEGIFREAWKILAERIGCSVETFDLSNLSELAELQERALLSDAIIVTEIWDLRDYSDVVKAAMAARVVKDLWPPTQPSSISKDGKATDDNEAYEHSVMILEVTLDEDGELTVWVYDPGFTTILTFEESEFLAMWFTREDETKPINEITGENIVRGRTWIVHPPTILDPMVFDPSAKPEMLPGVADYLKALGDNNFVAAVHDIGKLLEEAF